MSPRFTPSSARRVRGLFVTASVLAMSCLRTTAAPPVAGQSPDRLRFEYTIEDLGLIAPAGFSVAEGLNAAGTAVGTGVADANYRAAVFTGSSALGLLPLGGDASEAMGINDLGWIVGNSDVNEIHPAFGHFLSRGFVVLPPTPGGIPAGMYEIPTFGGLYSDAYDVNNAGQIVGSASLSGDGSSGWSHAYRWEAWDMTDLGTLGGDSSGARAINELGDVVGYSDTAAGDSHAFHWTAATGMEDLGTLGGLVSFALDVNDNGVVVGMSRTGEMTGISGTTFVQRAFVWRNGLMEPLGTLPIGPKPGGPYGPGNIHSIANGINNRDIIVGQSFPSPRAVIWRNSVPADLNRLIPANLGWVLTNATAINNAGQIVGAGRLNSQLRAYRLTPIPK